jgi:hypothetical protein
MPVLGHIPITPFHRTWLDSGSYPDVIVRNGTMQRPTFLAGTMTGRAGLSQMLSELLLSHSIEPVYQFHSKSPAILHNGGLFELLSDRIGVPFVEQVIEASRNSQFSQNILGIERGIRNE